jgi:hypothetical protein
MTIGCFRRDGMQVGNGFESRPHRLESSPEACGSAENPAAAGHSRFFPVMYHRVDAGLVAGVIKISCSNGSLVRVSSGAQLRHLVRRGSRRCGGVLSEKRGDGHGRD